MSRERFIDQDFFTSDSVTSISIPARLTLVGLIVMADDHGRGRGSPRKIQHALFPDGEATVDEILVWLKEIQKQGTIVLYDVDGVTYYYLPKWDLYQRLKYKSRSKIPPPPQNSPKLEKICQVFPNLEKTCQVSEKLGEIGENPAESIQDLPGSVYEERRGEDDDDGYTRSSPLASTSSLLVVGPDKKTLSAAAGPHPDLIGLSLFEGNARLNDRWPLLKKASAEAYPELDLCAEVREAHAWFIGHGERKKDLVRFIQGWFRKSHKNPSLRSSAASGTVSAAMDAMRKAEEEDAKYGLLDR